ncbi:MAG: ribbon-helix-helix protein, CopG family [Solirubrobacterales bacterium]|nr:ribbon-helix-helix protein, CopG family [Solirubrobacterales bacterium]
MRTRPADPECADIQRSVLYARPMAAKRTQIYLDDDLRERIDRARTREGRSLAAIVREALDRYLTEEQAARQPLGEGPPPAWVGAWEGEGSPLPELRTELERRAERLGR